MEACSTHAGTHPPTWTVCNDMALSDMTRPGMSVRNHGSTGSANNCCCGRTNWVGAAAFPFSCQGTGWSTNRRTAGRICRVERRPVYSRRWYRDESRPSLHCLGCSNGRATLSFSSLFPTMAHTWSAGTRQAAQSHSLATWRNWSPSSSGGGGTRRLDLTMNFSLLAFFSYSFFFSFAFPSRLLLCEEAA